MTTPIDRAAREIEAAKVLREQISALTEGDPDFIRDAIEGETNLRELLSALAAEEGEDAAQIEAADAFIAKVEVRRERIKARIEMRRALIANGMEIAELTKLETPTGTISVRTVAPKAIILEEADIPARFWIAAAPKLDKKALIAALKSKEEIPGATLSNGGKTVAILRG